MVLKPVDRAIFLDRDGLLNELVFYSDTKEWESPRVPEDLVLRPGAATAIRKLLNTGWHLFLVSNQPSAAKGKTTLRDLQQVHESLVSGFEPDAFTEAFYCHHHPDSIVEALRGPCHCRKPSPYFLEEAARRYGLSLSSCWMVGDQDTDIACGRAAGCRTILVPNPHSESKRGKEVPDRICDDLTQVLLAINAHL